MPREMKLPTESSPAQEPFKLIKRGFVPVWARWVTLRDDYRQTIRSLRWYGTCVVCHCNVYAFDDGENDPRGVLGDNALWATNPADGDESVEIRTCSLCANVSELVNRAQAIYAGLGGRGTAPLVWPR